MTAQMQAKYPKMQLVDAIVAFASKRKQSEGCFPGGLGVDSEKRSDPDFLNEVWVNERG
jgi:hypothetical protein